ncbi:putative oxygenase MesX, partial [Pseudoalteromonas sp. S3173]|uniref:putative oxygenase MesX n=1 Tax=Pseudoalteromonas sp. S3173 TaxID=579531 RepID=UPI0032D56CE2
MVINPNLNNDDHCLTQIVYDRAERGLLAVEQGNFTEQHFIKPYHSVLQQISAS